MKYDKHTSIEHIEKVCISGAILCFDFEDGIMNPFNKEMTSLLKEKAREDFIRLYYLMNNSIKNYKIGVRLNNNYTSDFEKDLIAIGDKKFDSIFLPKTEQLQDIDFILDKLNIYNIEYKNIIPIIESKDGMENLDSILQSNTGIKKIAFGHCDYNLNLNIYPFFHQDSWEYWKWINVLISISNKYEVQIINSPYLNIFNTDFYSSMLNYIVKKKNQFCGQVTLTTHQSELCNSITPSKELFTVHLENKNQISADKSFAINLISEFELNNKLKGLTKSQNNLISPQEYLASKQFIKDNRQIKEMCFIGGCFPVQHNIVYENLFHQKLKQEVENSNNIKFNINLIKYARFNTIINKIEAMEKQKQFDLIVFHVRPEPYLRLIKLLYKFIDDRGRLKWSLNLAFLNLLQSEKYDTYDLSRSFPLEVHENNSSFHKFLITCNYLLGILIGNEKYALKSCRKTTDKIIDYCKQNKINYIILGPNRRNNNNMEPALCKDLDKYISNRIDKKFYVSGFEENKTQHMNQENGIHVTQVYHDLIADKLFATILNENLLFSKSDKEQDNVNVYNNIATTV
ncbi:MAG TPA: aldolase/citrate lyase family protein [Chitinophagales bacterium]|nr:aldolase/citrate lyase family protein [Chitinophagales bacterium]